MPMFYNRGKFSFSGYPPHYGHLLIIREAAKKCRELVVNVANNASKSYLFTLDERVEMTRRMVREAGGLDNVRVIGDSGLMVDVYLRENCDVVFRGVRNEADEKYEKQVQEVNNLIVQGIRVEMVRTENTPFSVVSSSVVREIVAHHGGVEQMVPLFIKRAMEQRMLKQFLIAITGPIACGKSTVSRHLDSMARNVGCEVHVVNVDELIRDLYAERTFGAEAMRESLAGPFGADILLRTPGERFTTVNRKLLAERLFSATSGVGATHVERVRNKLTIAENLTKEQVKRKFREALRGLQGLIFMEWAELARMRMSQWTNNDVILVDSPNRAAFAAARGIDAARFELLNQVQLDGLEQQARLEEQIAADKCGDLFTYSNVRVPGGGAPPNLHLLLQKVLQHFGAMRVSA